MRMSLIPKLQMEPELRKGAKDVDGVSNLHVVPCLIAHNTFHEHVRNRTASAFALWSWETKEEKPTSKYQ